FLDKIQDGVWRLEVMPDAIHIRDPFERASPQKEVTRIEWQTQHMSISIPDLGEGFSVKGLNEGNNYLVTAIGNNFSIKPGTYLVTGLKVTGKAVEDKMGELGMNEFVAPQPFSKEPFVTHTPYTEVSSGKPFSIHAMIVSLDNNDKVTVQIIKLGGGFGQSRMIPMTKEAAYDYTATIPSELVTPGLLNYRIIIQKANDEYYVFPGNHKGNPFAWDNYINDEWQTFVAAENNGLEIYDPTTDKSIRVYPVFRRGFQTSYITGKDPGRLILKLSANELSGDHTIGFQYFFVDKLKGRESEKFDKLVIRARTAEAESINAKVTLTNTDGFSFSASVKLTDTFQDVEVPLNSLVPDSELLLPRPYPGFLPLWFKGSGTAVFKLSDMEKIQVTIGTDIAESEFKKPYSLEVESIQLQKSQ
ncbi:MAG TPA: membrane or secreted protein, partial [Chitinophagaceae bacterium]|nr:membrane or secreted protein [Chitinophagaceae bacterium]